LCNDIETIVSHNFIIRSNAHFEVMSLDDIFFFNLQKITKHRLLIQTSFIIFYLYLMKDGMSEKSNVQFGSFIFDLEMHQCRKYRTKKYVTLKIHKENSTRG
jgi:hypothetical protein